VRYNVVLFGFVASASTATRNDSTGLETRGQMKIRILSDLHLDFMSDLYASEFVRRLPRDCEVLVLAGDVSNRDGIMRALRLFAHFYKNIVYVKGNHELYGAPSPAEVEALLEEAPGNVHVLELGSVYISPPGFDGRRFLGCSLWFPPPTRGDKTCLTDFYAIGEFEPWVYERNRASVRWLAANVQPGDVVITHHLPAEESVHAKYKGSALNDFFVCDVRWLIETRRPALWIHGHTHESCDYQIGGTRVVCNPYGYFGHEVNQAFDPDKTVEV
jgi:Icc-related predicted phosphoesterase